MPGRDARPQRRYALSVAVARAGISGTALLLICTMLPAVAAEGQPTPAPPVGVVAEPAVRDTGFDVERHVAWLHAQPPGNYTIQLFADVSAESARHYILDQGIANRAAYFPHRHQNKPWYAVVYGSYSTYSAAKAGMQELGARLRTWSPWIRRFDSVQRALGSVADETTVASVPGQTLVMPEPKALTRPTKKTNPAEVQRILARGQGAFIAAKYRRALQVWLPLAREGVAEAQYGVGFLYDSGWGVEASHADAATWYRRAAAQEHPKAQFNLGMMHLDGYGVSSDQNTGMEWIRKSADAGHPRAQQFLADAYREGSYGLPQDQSQARYWSKRAVTEY